MFDFLNSRAVDCKDTFIPSICRLFYKAPDFNLNTILRYFFTFVLAALVLLVLWQIIKICFIWISHSNDEKAKGKAFKALFEIGIACLVFVVLMFGAVIVMDYLGIDLSAISFQRS